MVGFYYDVYKVILLYFYLVILLRGIIVCIIFNKNNMDMYYKIGIIYINKSIFENLLSWIEKKYLERNKREIKINFYMDGWFLLVGID